MQILKSNTQTSLSNTAPTLKLMTTYMSLLCFVCLWKRWEMSLNGSAVSEGTCHQMSEYLLLTASPVSAHRDQSVSASCHTLMLRVFPAWKKNRPQIPPHVYRKSFLEAVSTFSMCQISKERKRLSVIGYSPI